MVMYVIGTKGKAEKRNTTTIEAHADPLPPILGSIWAACCFYALIYLQSRNLSDALKGTVWCLRFRWFNNFDLILKSFFHALELSHRVETKISLLIFAKK
jgi:hypothetical protein